MIGGSCTILPCDIRGWRCFTMPKRKALFAHGKPLNDGVAGIFQFLSHGRFFLFPYLYIAKERMAFHALLCFRRYEVLWENSRYSFGIVMRRMIAFIGS